MISQLVKHQPFIHFREEVKDTQKFVIYFIKRIFGFIHWSNLTSLKLSANVPF